MIKVIVFLNKVVLLSEIQEVPSEIGEPDCKLIKPFQVDSNGMLKNWLSEYTSQSEFMIHSDKILTITDPTELLVKKYEEVTKK